MDGCGEETTCSAGPFRRRTVSIPRAKGSFSETAIAIFQRFETCPPGGGLIQGMLHIAAQDVLGQLVDTATQPVDTPQAE